MIEEGNQAPNFECLDDKENKITLADFKGKKLVLFFYPKDNTPGCTRESIAFSELKETFNKKNTEVVGVSKDSVSSHQSFCEKQKLSVQLLSDPETKMIQDYGVWQEKKNYGKTYMGVVRSTILINEEGIVDKVWRNVRVDGHAEKVLEEVSK